MTTAISLIPEPETTGDPELDALLRDFSEFGKHRHCFGIWAFRFFKQEIGECDRCGDRNECEERVADERSRAMPWKCFGGGPHDVGRTGDCGYRECGLSGDCKTVADWFFGVNPLLRAKFHDLARKEMPVETVTPTSTAPIDASVHVPAETEAPVLPSREAVCVTAGAAVATHSTGVPGDESATKDSKMTKVLPKAPVRVGIPVDGLSFRALKKSYNVFSTTELRSLVHSISHGTVPGIEETFPYSQVREGFLAVSLVLNERGEIAPQFRDRRRVPHLTHSDDDQTYARDLMVIDMHWLYCHHVPHPVLELAFIFNPDGFRFDLAWQYASKPITAPIRAEFLGLGSFEEHCLSMIHSLSTKETWKRLREGRGVTIRRIKDATRLPGSRRKDGDSNMLYDVYRAIEVMDGIISNARGLFALMGYPMPSKTDFGRKVEWLERHRLWTRPLALKAA